MPRKPRKKPRCQHLWQTEQDQFGDPRGYSCTLCPAWCNLLQEGDRLAATIKKV